MVLPYQKIKQAVYGKVPAITAPEGSPVTEDQIQPASLDVRIGKKVYRNWAATVSHGRFVTDLLDNQRKYDFELFKNRTNALEKDHTYLIELMEGCALPEDMYLEFSPKSSTGRCDVFARVVCDRYSHYDLTPPGYHGPLYLEVTPKSFDVSVELGLSLMQARLKTVGTQAMDDREIRDLHMSDGLLYDNHGKPIPQNKLEIRDRELFFHIDLTRDVVGFAVKNTVMKPLDLTAKGTLEPDDFWQPIRRPKNGELVLVPEHFYLLATKERVRIPADVCGQIPAYSTTIGEMRTHYAGFFDPKFGGMQGTNGVLEVRVRDMPFTLVDGQVVCSMKFERLEAAPEKVYGESGSNYTGSGPSLSKHFREREGAWYPPYWRSLWE